MECCDRIQNALLNNFLTLVNVRVESNPLENVVDSSQGPYFESEGAKVFSLKTILFNTLR